MTLRRRLVYCITIGALAGAFTYQLTDLAWAQRPGPCTGRLEYRWMANDIDGTWTRVKAVRKERAENVARCAARFYGIDVARFLAVGDRESGFWHRAYNPSGASGLYQHLRTYWPSRAGHLLRERWFGGHRPGPFNARANAIVSARMWRAQGGPCPAWC